MRIGIIAFSGIYPVDIGGPGNVAYFLAKELGRMGHQVTLFVRGKDDEAILALKCMPEFSQLSNVEVVPIKLDYDAKFFVNPVIVAHKIMETCLKFRQKDFDVVLHNSPPIDIGLLIPLICRFKGTRQAIILHGLFHYHGLLHENPLGRLMIRFHRRFFEASISPGELPKRESLPCGFRKDRVVVIPNGVPTTEIRKASPINLKGNPRILHTGVLSKRKGVDTLLRAVSVVAEDYPSLRLYLVGDGPERANLERLSALLRIEKQVEFVGFVKDTRDVFRYYKSCDVFVMPSLSEAFGITLAEAMACKIPVIASDIDGAPRMLIKSGTNGYLFPPNDWGALSKRILMLLGNETLQKNFVDVNFRIIEDQYTWEKIAGRYLTVFNRILQQDSTTS